jgi:hypothetical protein
MTWPSSDVPTTNLDAGTDNPQTARADLLSLAQAVNLLRNHFSTFMRGVVEAVDAAAARTALGASTVGSNLFTAPDQAAARSAIGGTTVGNSVLTAADGAAARTAIGAADAAATVNLTGAQTVAGLKTFSDSFRSTNTTTPFGYTVGAGAVVVQNTSKTTAVTLNRVCGQIQSEVGNVSAGASFEFVFNNSAITSVSLLIVIPTSTSGNFSYRADVLSIGSGVAHIRVTNVTGGARNEAVVLNFAVIRGANT